MADNAESEDACSKRTPKVRQHAARLPRTAIQRLQLREVFGVIYFGANTLVMGF